MRIHHLSCGTLCPFGGRWINGDAPPWKTGRMICHVLLIETDRSGLVLVDTGMGLADVEDPAGRLGRFFVAAVRPKLRAEDTAARQVEALGFRREDVRHIVLTHMDLDHAGGLPDFPKATVHVLAQEHLAATTRPTFEERSRYRAVQWAHEPTFERYEPAGEPWKGLPCVRGLRGLPPEILFVPLVGHSRGHAAVAVDTGPRWLVHAGDAYFHAAQMDPERPRCTPLLSFFQRTVAIDRAAMLANQERLRELARDHAADVTVFSAHDPSELDALQRAPSAAERAA
jgi:glyoxylase-like metal-dependent hydrolase (beta-lactamase superfamily II)